MAFLEINPRYQRLLEQENLVAPAQFLEMPSVILCGHPNRHVARVTLGTGSLSLVGYLKREHRVAWKERLCNAAAGFGFVSKSSRELQTLRRLQQAGIRCPDWIAMGEDNQGRAFLLLREVAGTQELRSYLHHSRHAPEAQRRQCARKLGEALAGFHNAGFDHPDLYSKHVLIGPDEHSVTLLDWQRSRHRPRVSWGRRCRDLAALEATLAEGLATVRERLICLRAYLFTSSLPRGKSKSRLRALALSIRRRADRLLRQRRIRELCRVPEAKSTQRLIWLDGEALCVTPEFQAALAGNLPDWLLLGNSPLGPDGSITRTWVDLPRGRRGLLLRRRQNACLGGLWAWLQRRPTSSPEVRSAGLLFRLERYGILAPRLLAFGQRSVSWRCVESFLLIEPPVGALCLSEWLARHSTERSQCRQVIREAAHVLRRIHDLHCYFRGQPCFAVVQPASNGEAKVVLASMDDLCSRRRSSTRQARRDVLALQGELSSRACARTERLRLLLSYMGEGRRSAAVKRLLRVRWRCDRSVAHSLPILARLRAKGGELHGAEQGAVA